MKKTTSHSLLLLTSIFFVFSTCSKEDSFIIPTRGLVCYYEFSGNAKDISANGNDGFVIGAELTNDRNGILNEAYYFNGEDTYIERNAPSFINDSVGTFISWFKINNLPKVEYVGSVSDTSTIDYYISLIRIDPIDSTIGIYYREPLDANLISGQIKIKTGVYNQCAMVADGKRWHLYINGQKDSLIVKAGMNSGKWFNNLSNNIDKFTIGNLIIKEPYTKPPFDGIIDQVLIYNRVLSDAEIKYIYLNTK
jgi:hypothetical protein